MKHQISNVDKTVSEFDSFLTFVNSTNYYYLAWIWTIPAIILQKIDLL
jgi:hypothetical protein